MQIVAPLTFQAPELIIPPRSLLYGTYKVTFTARMWDDSIADPNWTKKLPFQNDAFTYIKIIESPLKVMLIKGAVSAVTRGYGQSILLEPYIFSEDPDFPEMQVSNIRIKDSINVIKPF